MPIVWDPETGKYSAKKISQAERSLANSPPVSPPNSALLDGLDDNIDIQQVMQLQDAMLQMAEEVSRGGDPHAALKTAIAASEHQRKRAEVSEARCARLQEAMQDLEGQVQNAARNSGLEMTLQAKSREIADLQSMLQKVKQESRVAVDNQRGTLEKELREQKESFDKALAHAQTVASQELLQGLEQEREKARKALELKVAQMDEQLKNSLEEQRAQHKRKDAELMRGHTKEMSELLAALSKPDGRGNKKGETSSDSKNSKSNKVVNKAKLRVESWEIANLGRQMIELMHMLLERLERLTLVVGDETSSSAAAKRASSSTGQEDVRGQLRAHTRIVFEDLIAARDQLYAQLYSQDNLLGFHYMRNYPMRDQNAPSPEVLAKLDLTQDLSSSISC